MTDPEHIHIIKTETHHGHELVLDKTGTVRWKPDPEVCEKMNGLNFNKVIQKFLYYFIEI